jgi:hypothetical protein
METDRVCKTVIKTLPSLDTAAVGRIAKFYNWRVVIDNGKYARCKEKTN